MLHENMPDISHGAIAAERLVVTPNARLVVVEHVMGSALEQLRYSQERYWRELRIAVPRSAGLPRFDHRADVAQLGVVALSLIMGRGLHDEEGPSRLGDLVSSAWAVSARGGLEPLPAGLRAWMMCALQLDPRNSFESAIDAQEELERVLGESDYLAAPATLESFLERYRAAADSSSTATMAEAPRPITVSTPEPMHAAAAEPKPILSQPAVSQPTASQPTVSQPAVSRPTVSQPAAGRPAVRPVIVHDELPIELSADRDADADCAATLFAPRAGRTATPRRRPPARMRRHRQRQRRMPRPRRSRRRVSPRQLRRSGARAAAPIAPAPAPEPVPSPVVAARPNRRRTTSRSTCPRIDTRRAEAVRARKRGSSPPRRSA